MKRNTATSEQEMKLKYIFTAVYIALIILIIFLANSGALHSVIKPLQKIPYFDKWGHFFLVGMLAFVVNIALSLRTIKFLKFKILLGSLIVVVIMTLEEFSQAFVSSRTFDLIDLTADYVGIICFSYLALWIHKKDKIDKKH